MPWKLERNVPRREPRNLAGCGKSRFGKKVRKTNRTQLPQEREMGRG